MKEKKQIPAAIWWGVIGIALISVATLLFFLIYNHSGIEHRFPMWEEAPEEPREPGFENIEMEFVGIDFDVPSGNQTVDQVLLTVENTGTNQVGYSMRYHIDYLYEGAWYMIYQPEEVMLAAQTLGPGSAELSFSVPTGLLTKQGLYRIFIDGLGYCELDISMDLEG